MTDFKLLRWCFTLECAYMNMWYLCCACFATISRAARIWEQCGVTVPTSPCAFVMSCTLDLVNTYKHLDLRG